jgi:ribonuclease T2
MRGFHALWAAAIASVLMSAPGAPVRADGEPAGDFDYYVMALSWSPAWCALEGDDRGDPQCDAGRRTGFVLHGLWPQYADTGWPAYCRTSERDPSRGDTRAVADLFGGAGAAFYQWKKHGRCSGLSSSDYFDLAARAVGQVSVPDLFRRVTRDLSVAPEVIEAAFLDANPAIAPDAVIVTCRDGFLTEVRICLDRDLAPIPCTGSAARACPLAQATLEGLR